MDRDQYLASNASAAEIRRDAGRELDDATFAHYLSLLTPSPRDIRDALSNITSPTVAIAVLYAGGSYVRGQFRQGLSWVGGKMETRELRQLLDAPDLTRRVLRTDTQLNAAMLNFAATWVPPRPDQDVAHVVAWSFADGIPPRRRR